MNNVEAQKSQNAGQIFMFKSINSINYIMHDNFITEFLSCCSVRRAQEQRIEQETAQSKSNIQEFFSLQEKASKFYIPPEIVEKICNFVRFYEKASHDFVCPRNVIALEKDNINIIDDYKIKKDIKDIIVSQWYEGRYSEEKDQQLDYINKLTDSLALSSPQIQQQPEEGLLALMWHSDWHQNQNEIQDKVMGDAYDI